MEMKDKKPKMNFEGLAEKDKDFDLNEVLDKKNKFIEMPDMIKNDLKKMEMFSSKKWKK